MYWLIIAGVLWIVLAIGVPIWLGERAWRRNFRERVDEIDERSAMKDYRL
jgi:hypothetical protein